MPHVVALYRYPIKGFKPQACSTLTVLDEGRIAGDRALAFRFANNDVPDKEGSSKHEHAVLVNAPGLARLDASIDRTQRRLGISLGGDVLVEDSLDAEGRTRIAAAVERYVLSLPEHPLAQAERRPLRLVGDGETSRYQDNARGEVTLHSRETLTSVADALNDREVDEARFRSNIAIEGVSAWEENDWVGRRIRVGAVEFTVTKSLVRCLATHANPTTGERDRRVMQTLVRTFHQDKPTFGISLLPTRGGGELRVGDEVRALD